jgi:Domain of unknown function (DUF2017)
MTVRFRRSGDALRASLTDEEVKLLRSLPDQLRPVLEAPVDRSDPVRDRLFPKAYLDPTQEESEREWQQLVHPELVRERVAKLSVLGATLERGRSEGGRVEVDLSEEEVQAWLGVLNDARLALGTQLGVTEDFDDEEIGEEHPDAVAYAIYGWLTWVEGDLVEALLG